MQRRHFLASAIAASLAGTNGFANEKRPPRILIRSAWQTVNIGDVAHTPGVLAILEKHMPEAELVLWPSDIGNGVEEMLRKRFPKLIITPKNVDERVKITKTCDFFLHGSGAFLCAPGDVARWRATGKPYGIYGITMAAEGDYALGLMNNKGLDANIHSLLSDASFVFLRDGVSLKVVKDAGVKSPIVEFGPDGAFGTDVRDDEKAHAYMQQHGLEKDKFLCCIPNLRGAPYWRMKAGRKFDPQRHARNEEMKEQDHAPLREAIIAVVKETEMKILLCPEDSSHMEVNKELLYDPLPEDIKKRVVWRSEFWLTDEALSTYHASAGMFSADMHSPIMCIGNGIPAIHCRQIEKTSKGYMWKDIGLEDWLFDLDIAEDRARIPAAVLAMAKDPEAAKAKAEAAQKRVQAFQEHTIKVLKSSQA